MTAALLGIGWDAALTGLSKAAGARGVALIRNRQRRLVGAVVSPGIAEPIAQFLAGQAPPSSRQTRVSHHHQAGFRTDFDDYTQEQLDRDPFYQDFLRPIGAFWHANARLGYEPGEEVAVSFKRDLVHGPYERGDTVLLDGILPDLKAAARVAHRILDAEVRGMLKVLHRRGDPVFEIDTWGQVIRAHDFEPGKGQPVRLAGRTLTTAGRVEQDSLNRALATVLAAPRRPAIASLSGLRGERWFLQFVPVTGQARDVFLSAAAVGILIGRRPTRMARALDAALIQQLFDLTEREVDVVLLLCRGQSAVEIATTLGVQIGTSRFHLKRVFEKTGTGRQAELVGLLGRLAL